MLSIKLESGDNLCVRDKSGKSDPYVIFQIDGKTVATSKIIKQNLNPVWNQEMQIPFDASTAKLMTITCMDQDKMTSDDFMGTAELKLSSLKNGKWSGQLKLKPLKVTEVDSSSATSSSSSESKPAKKKTGWFSSHFSMLHVTPSSSEKTRSEISGNIKFSLAVLSGEALETAQKQYHDAQEAKASKWKISVTKRKKNGKLAESNIDGIGSSLDKDMRKAAAATEKAYEGAGQKVGLECWRIENFSVARWSKSFYYNGDSYIFLNTWKKPNTETLMWDVFFWIGAESTQDEYGSAAYMTVALDDLLNGAPIQHREVSGGESEKFLAMFKKGFIKRNGGIDSGFTKAVDPYDPSVWKKALFQVKGRGKSVYCTEVACKAQSLNSGDCFILDCGYDLFLWIGTSANPFEKNRARTIVQGMKHERGTRSKLVDCEQGSEPADFWTQLGGKGTIASAKAGGDDKKAGKKLQEQYKLFRFSDASGHPLFSEEARGSKIQKSLLDSDDVFIVDAVYKIFIWIGKGSSRVEKATSFRIAAEYLKKTGRAPKLPITRIMEGHEISLFNDVFN